MKRIVTIATVAAAAAMVMTPASAGESRDLYMGKGIRVVDSIPIGEFAVLRKSGRNVFGAVGALSSEYYCIKGTVSGGKLRARYYENGVAGARYVRAWVGSGDSQHIKRMEPVTKADARVFLQGSPTRFLRACRNQVN